jgi:hypothetical protein
MRLLCTVWTLNHSDIKFHENPPSGRREVPCGQTDIHNKALVAFCNIWNRLTNTVCYVAPIRRCSQICSFQQTVRVDILLSLLRAHRAMSGWYVETESVARNTVLRVLWQQVTGDVCFIVIADVICKKVNSSTKYQWNITWRVMLTVLDTIQCLVNLT